MSGVMRDFPLICKYMVISNLVSLKVRHVTVCL